MKKILTIILSLIFCMAGITACGADGDLTVKMQIGNSVMTVNDTEKTIDEDGTVPILMNGRTLLPVRAVVEEIGGAVKWEEETQTAILTYGDNEILLTIDSPTAYLNGEPRTLDVAPALINDRTMLPIRFIAESFDFDVAWSEQTQTVTITKGTEAVKPTSAPLDNDRQESKTLVAYFSATNNTEGVAKYIADGIGADIYEILPEVPYTAADLDYNSDCRANREQNDTMARPAISGTFENMEQYDTVFLGYPIWWGNAPKIIFTFLESYDFSGKTIIPFCTSESSPIGSATAMQNVTPGANWLDGRRFAAGASKDSVAEWIDSLKIDFGSDEEVSKMRVQIGDAVFTATLEDNAAVGEFVEMMREAPVTINMSDYSGFEKVGFLGLSLTTGDVQMTTSPGDIVLYSGNQIVMFYAPNSWSYTKIGHIDDLTGWEDALGSGDITAVFSIAE